LHHGPTQLGLDRDKVMTCLNHYLALKDHSNGRGEAEERMLKRQWAIAPDVVFG